MKIDNAQVAMAGSSEQFSLTSYRISTVVETKPIGDWLAELSPEQLNVQAADESVQLDLSAEGKRAAETYSVQASSPWNVDWEDYRIQLMRAMFRILTGKELPVKKLAKPAKNTPINQMWEKYARMNTSKGDTQVSGNLTNGFVITGNSRELLNRKLNLEVTRQTETTYQSERVQFAMNAQVNTSDGKTIDVQLQLNMSQEFYSKVETTLAQNVKDPLVINFNAPSAAVADTKINFDIDSDGTEDQISQLAAGSGFLAVDWNDSGVVKDGSQLFGTKSGDGFADLAAHDADRNGWIDENDAIFDKLRVWMWDDSGEGKLLALGELGIGAIYLGKVGTNYSLNMQGPGQADAYIRSTGFFLREDGTAGTVQHVDMVV